MRAVPQAATQQPHSMQRSSSLNFSARSGSIGSSMRLQVDVLALHVQPGLEPLARAAHPLAGVHRQVADQLEHRQRRERDLGADVARQRAAGERRPAVDHHRAAAADAGAADEVELQRWIQLLADLGQRDEQRHALGLLELVGLHVRHARGILRVVAQDVQPDLRGARRLVLGGGHRFAPGCAYSLSQAKADSGVSFAPESRSTGKRSSIRSFRPR